MPRLTAPLPWSRTASRALVRMSWLGVFALSAAAFPAAAQTPRAELRCTPAARHLAFDCTAQLTRGGAPLTGAELAVSADMPSMPMAHNVKPVTATPSAVPGEYTFPLDLEMYGEWAVRLRLSAPVRDLLVVHLRFTKTGVAPATPAASGGGRALHRH
jgi:hypothetical protein